MRKDLHNRFVCYKITFTQEIDGLDLDIDVYIEKLTESQPF